MLFNLTRISLDVSFGRITLWRMLQVLGLPFIFIPISTLNYVGVPRDKSNQISSFSNFARNLGGSMGTAMLTTFLTRTAQTHQDTLAANTANSMTYNAYIDKTKVRTHGPRTGWRTRRNRRPWAMPTSADASARPPCLSYMNAFWVLSVIIACLVPLPFIMRKPPPRVAASAEATGH